MEVKSQEILEDRRGNGESAALPGAAARSAGVASCPPSRWAPAPGPETPSNAGSWSSPTWLAAAIALVVFVSLLGDDALTLAAFAALPIVVLIAKVDGLYDRDDLLLRKTTLDEVPELFRLATLFALVIWLLQDSLAHRKTGRRAGVRDLAGFLRGDGGDASVRPIGGEAGSDAGALHRPRGPRLRRADPRAAGGQPGHRRRRLRRAAAGAEARGGHRRRVRRVERRPDQRGRQSLRRPSHPGGAGLRRRRGDARPGAAGERPPGSRCRSCPGCSRWWGRRSSPTIWMA